jgi:upstream activation factor subunit UAF30
MIVTALPPDVEASYTRIIDNILSASDLNTISAKRIRKALQEEVDHDILAQKVILRQYWRQLHDTDIQTRMP